MAFETFLTVDKQKPRKGRRITFLVSLAVHGVMLAVGVAMSFAGVDELAPKNGTLVTILNLPPVPPPPAGPKKNPVKKRTNVQKLPAFVSKSILVQPTDRIKEAKSDEPDGPPCEGPQCSEIDGPPGGGGGGQVVSMLPPNVSKGFLAINPQETQYRAQLPPGIARAGMSVSALLRVCVDREGRVVDVKVLKGDDQTVNQAFVAAVRTWRYHPYKVNGSPVPFCTPVNYTVQTTN